MNKQQKMWIKANWLNSRGGRDWSDLKKDSNGEIVARPITELKKVRV
jgi:hypothetical protein